jgi:predicted nuclease with TOPRIM domain
MMPQHEPGYDPAFLSAEQAEAVGASPGGSHFVVGLRKQGSGQLEDIMTTIEKYKMRIQELEEEKAALVEEADLATRKAADLEALLGEQRRLRKEEKAIRIEAEEEMKRAQDQRDKLEFELSVIVDEIGLVHHAMED